MATTTDSRTEMAITLSLTATFFAIYAAGACRTIYVGDSGELVAAVHTLGIPHPSGYPLYVLMGKLWTLLVPLGSIAFRMSLFSAATAAAACGLAYRVAREAGIERPAALLGAALLGLGPSFWSQATIQRVYGLNALFVVLATLLALRWHRERRPSQLAAAFGVCGLGASNHTFMGLYAIALGLAVVLAEPAILRRPRELVACLAATVLGLLPYLYLPLRSAADPRLDWGNPETLQGFIAVLLRRDFWDRAWLEGPADLLPIAADYLASLGPELAWAGAGLALIALAAWRRHPLPVALPLLVMAANLASMALHGSRPDLFIWHRYYIPSYVMAALLAAAGAQALMRLLSRRAGWLLLLVPLTALLTGWPTQDRSRYRLAEDFSRRVLDAVEPGGHLVASDDNVLFVLIYLQLVEGLRPDVDLILQGVGSAELPPLRFRPEDEGLYFTHHPNWKLQGLESVPLGPVFRIWRPELPRLEPQIDSWWLDGERDPRVPRDYLTRNLVGHFHYMLGITFERRHWPTASQQLALAARAAPDNDVLFYNLGLIFSRNGLFGQAREAFLRAHQINPRHLPSLSRPRPSDRLREVQAELERLERIGAKLERASPELDTLQPAARHQALAALLAGRGEPLAARGHLLRAEELEAGLGEQGALPVANGLH